MRISWLVLLGFLCLPAGGEDWTHKLSPRMRAAFQEMARDDWKPQKAAELTEKEKQEWSALWQRIRLAPPPAPLTPAPPAPQLSPTPSLEGK